MYSIIVVDDEDQIRNGIIENCDWNKFEISKVFSASNGLEALEILNNEHVDMIITDMKMPVMDGLKLIKEVQEKFPDIQVAVLSGHDEFTFAQAAMKYNVNEYLLKPCSIEGIYELLENMTKMIKDRADLQKYISETEEKYQKLRAQLKEQALKDFITNAYYQYNDLIKTDEYSDLNQKELRLVLFQLNGASETFNLFSLMVTCKKVLSKKHQVFLCSICNDQVMVVTEYYTFNELKTLLNSICSIYNKYNKSRISIVVGEKTALNRLKSSYKNLIVCSTAKFYTNNSDIITTYDLPKADVPKNLSDFNIDYLNLAIQCGNQKETDDILDRLFAQLQENRISVDRIRVFITQVYLNIIQNSSKFVLSDHLEGIVKISSMERLSDLRQVLSGIIKELIKDANNSINKKQNELVKQVIEIIQDNIQDEKLSLSHIANEILFVNADYLGKLFKTEWPEGFSKHLNHARISLAQELFQKNPSIKVNEVARLTGFGYNAQYFSKVFKEVTSYTPKEYHVKFNVTNK